MTELDGKRRVWIDTDGCSWHTWLETANGRNLPHVDIDDKEWEEYVSYNNLHEYWQKRLNAWADKARAERILASIPPLDTVKGYKFQ